MKCEAKGCKKPSDDQSKPGIYEGAKIRLCIEHRKTLQECSISEAKDVDKKIKCPKCGEEIEVK